MTYEKKLRENNFTLKKMKFTRTNYFTDSEYYRVLRYSADPEYRMVTRYSPTTNASHWTIRRCRSSRHGNNHSIKHKSLSLRWPTR